MHFLRYLKISHIMIKFDFSIIVYKLIKCWEHYVLKRHQFYRESKFWKCFILLVNFFLSLLVKIYCFNHYFNYTKKNNWRILNFLWLYNIWKKMFLNKWFSYLIELPICNSEYCKTKFTGHWSRYSTTPNVPTLFTQSSQAKKIALLFFAATYTWS